MTNRERSPIGSARAITGGVLAQIDVAPSNYGLPGAEFWQQIPGWLAWGGLAGSLTSLLIGGAVWGLDHQLTHHTVADLDAFFGEAVMDLASAEDPVGLVEHPLHLTSKQQTPAGGR